MFEIAVLCPRDAEVGVEFLVDVDQAGRGPHAGLHRKAQAVRLSRAVIGILPQDDDAHGIGGRQVERAEPLVTAREDALACLPLRGQEGLQRLHIVAVEFGLEGRQPSGVQLDALAHCGPPDPWVRWGYFPLTPR